MDWKTLLTNEAISNYLVFGAGLLVGLLVHVIRKYVRKPSIIRLEKQKEVSLIELTSDAKERLKITYQEEIVKEFHLTLFELSNKSDRVIEDIQLKLYLDENQGKQQLYEMVIDDPLEDTRQPSPKISCVVEESGTHYLSIEVPFLNDARNHRDALVIRIYSPKPIHISRLVGGGKGWITQFFDRVAFNHRLERIVRESNSFGKLTVDITGLISKRYR